MKGRLGLAEKGVVRDFVLDLQNPLVSDYDGKTSREGEITYADALTMAEENGHDGAIFRNTKDAGEVIDIYAVFNPSQIKSADPVTYDESGNVIPLSQRFNPARDEISYSVITNAESRIDGATGPENIAPGSQADIEARDAAYFDAVESGDLQSAQRIIDDFARASGFAVGPVWHGTTKGKFTKFDVGKQARGNIPAAAYFTTDNRAAVMIATHGGFGQWRKKRERERILAERGLTVNPSVYRVFLRLGNILEDSDVDFHGLVAAIEKVTEAKRREAEAKGYKPQNSLRASQNQRIEEFFSVEWNEFAEAPDGSDGAYIYDGEPYDSLLEAAEAAFESGDLDFFSGNDTEMLENSPRLRMVVSDWEIGDEFVKAGAYDGLLTQDGEVSGVMGRESNTYVVFNPDNILISNPILRDESGNLIPPSKRFPSNDPSAPGQSGASYSVITNAESRIAESFNPFLRNPEKRLKIVLEAQRRATEKARGFQEIIREARTVAQLDREQAAREGVEFGKLLEETFGADTEALRAGLPAVDRDAARSEAKSRAAKWRKGQDRGQKGIDRATLIAAMRTLDAMISALPSEIRGKIGGMVRLAQFKGPEAMLNELEKRANRLDTELERWLKKESRRMVDKLLERAKVKKTPKGIPKSNLPADTISELQAIKEFAELTKPEYDKRLSDLAAELEDAANSAASDAIIEKMIRLVGFGHIDGMDSAQLSTVAENLKSPIERGRTIKQVMDEERAAEVRRVVGLVNHDVTGGKGEMTSSEAKRRATNRKGIGGVKGAISGLHRRNLSFEWIMNGLARENPEVGTLASESGRELSELVHEATHAEKRANLKSAGVFRDFLSTVFGKKGVPLSKKLEKLSEEIEKTGAFRYDYGLKGRTSKREIRVSNVRSVIEGSATPDSLGLDASEWAAINAEYAAMVNAAKGKGQELKGDRIVRYEVKNKGKKEELTLSQEQAINLTMLYRQKDLKESMIEEGYSEATMKQMEDFLSDESKAIRDWLTDFYGENHAALNKVFKVENGVNLPKIEFYSPAARKAKGTEKSMGIDGEGGTAMTTTPSFLISRVTNFAQMDQTAGALSLYARHSAQSNHYIAWAGPVKMLRGVFGNAEVKKNIEDYQGRDHLSLVNERIEWFADGGNRKAGHYALLDSLRNTFTLSALSWNVFTAMKQLTSLPAYMFDMPYKDFAKYSAEFMKDVPGNIREMLETEYVKARLEEGYERDVISALRGNGGHVKTGLQMGMLPTKIGDIVPVVIGGWMAKRRAEDMATKAKMSPEQVAHRGRIAFEMATDRAQQAGDLKDLSHFQGGGSLFKLFTMFKTSPRQYYANVYESLLDSRAGKAGAKQEFARRLLIGQVILPIVFQFASDLLRSPFNDEDEPDYELPDYIRTVLLGPLNGLFIFGDFAELITSGLSDTKIWFEELPVFSGPTEVAGALQEFWDGDFEEGIDELLRGMGRMSAPFTYYEIFRRETDRLGITD